jgi:hypothetical protein
MAGHRVEVGDTGTTFGEREVSTATMSAFMVAFLARLLQQHVSPMSTRRWLTIAVAGRLAEPLPPRHGRLAARGLAETLTITGLGVPPTLARPLRATNSIESMIEVGRDHAANARALAGRPDGAALGGGRHP